MTDSERAPSSELGPGPAKTRRLGFVITVVLLVLGAAAVVGGSRVRLELLVSAVRPTEVGFTPSGDMKPLRGAAKSLMEAGDDALPVLLPQALVEAQTDEAETWRGLALICAQSKLWSAPAGPEPLSSTREEPSLPLLQVIASALESRHRGLSLFATNLVLQYPDPRLLDSLLALLETLRREPSPDAAALRRVRQAISAWVSSNGRWSRADASSGAGIDPQLQAWLGASLDRRQPKVRESAMEGLREWRGRLGAAGLPEQIRYRAEAAR